MPPRTVFCVHESCDASGGAHGGPSGGHHLGGRIGEHARLTEAAQQHQSLPPTFGLLVETHRGSQGIGTDGLWNPSRQAKLCDRSGQGLRVGAGPPSRRLAGRHGRHQPDRHRLAVAQVVMQQRLEGVGEGVAEVQVGPLPPLEFVAAHHGGLDGGGTAHEVHQHGRLSSLDGGVVRGDPIEQPRVRDQRMLHALRQAAAVVARRKRAQRVHVAQHPRRRMERASHVLAEAAGWKRQVHRRLAADRCVHHGQQRGGHHHQWNAALIGGRREARQVADHATAEGHQHIRALHACLQHGRPHALHGGDALA